MRIPMAMTAVMIVATATHLVAQDTNRTRWSISAGVSYLDAGAGMWVSGTDKYNVSMQDTVVFPGTDNVGHLALGLARPLGSTALVARAELLYNRNQGKPLDFTWMPNERRALREDDFVLSAGLQWDARPKGGWSPYLLTTAGLRNTRIGWSTDSLGTRPDRHVWGYGPLLNLGAGVRLTAGSHEYFAEWRWSVAQGTVIGSRLTPISVGIRF